MTVLEYLKNNIIYLDGGMGSLLQAEGLMPGERPETWNLSHPDVVERIQRSYYEAGSNIVITNTFGANLLHYGKDELDKIVTAAIAVAKKARASAAGNAERFVALDIGPLGRLLAPYGDLDFEEAVGIFAETVKIGAREGADLIFIETMNDSYETKAALLAAKENSSLPVFVSNAYGENGKLMTGADPKAMVAMLEGLHADAIGANCSLGPKQLHGVIAELLKYASVPVIFKPNAGLPCADECGCAHYDISPSEFADEVTLDLRKGVRIAGGCCGTTPEYIKMLTEKSNALAPVQPASVTETTLVSSYTHAVEFGREAVLIGERINPTGKKRFQQALRENDIAFILREGVSQQEKGVDILDVNVGLPGTDEKEMLVSVCGALQAISDLPLQIDTSDPSAMEAALRCYNGKAMINSVNGKQEVMDAVFPLAAKYGGVIVALTLDENGIPDTAAGRVEIAKKVLREAAKYGISKKDLVFDTLAMTISADGNAAVTTLNALRTISEDLGCKTSLGISNVSFGLPRRDIVNSTFFGMAKKAGLSAAIMNPFADYTLYCAEAECALAGHDADCASFIAYADGLGEKPQTVREEPEMTLARAVEKGLREQASAITAALLSEKAPLDIVSSDIIPALDTVGRAFESGRLYLPQLLMSAEAAACAFEQIKQVLPPKTDSCGETGDTIIIATVKGDIHDIGKNIVKLLLENYGFNVRDLGKDVAPERVLEEALKTNSPLVGLSALMTTTVPAMAQTISLLREKAPGCKICVGGAVLTDEYAKEIGADFYSPTALDTVNYAKQVIK